MQGNKRVFTNPQANPNMMVKMGRLAPQYLASLTPPSDDVIILLYTSPRHSLKLRPRGFITIGPRGLAIPSSSSSASSSESCSENIDHTLGLFFFFCLFWPWLF